MKNRCGWCETDPIIVAYYDDLMFQVLILERLQRTFLVQSKRQDQEVDYADVDMSSGTLNRARAAHPDIEYIEGDMRILQLNRQFDAVAIPDSIDYMMSLEDLKRAIQTAVEYLKTGGVYCSLWEKQKRHFEIIILLIPAAGMTCI
jgi:SAM-dependent methyltransferase